MDGFNESCSVGNRENSRVLSVLFSKRIVGSKNTTRL